MKCDRCNQEIDDVNSMCDYPDFFAKTNEKGEHPRANFCVSCYKYCIIQAQMGVASSMIDLATHYQKLLIEHGILKTEEFPKGE